MNYISVGLFVLFFALSLPLAAFAQEESSVTVPLDTLAYTIDNAFLWICATLVIMMQAGFAMLEVGFNARKNTINILCKNLMDLSIGVLLFYGIGYAIMYPGPDYAGGLIGFGGFGVSSDAPNKVGPGILHPQIDWFFQVAFAATAATIVSGAVAGRLKFSSYLVYSALLTGFIYPISGMWKWGGGWLDAMGFYDFAGSVVVHAAGGFAGLAGAIILGPRIGRFGADGTPQAMPGHSASLATLGTFFLWVGWYGFNCGSQLAIFGIDNTNAVALIAANTTISAAAGAVTAMFLTWLSSRKPDLSMALNGALAGLVGITASCDSVSNGAAIVIGFVAGVLVYMGTKFLEKIEVDDPVGAWPVHGLAGVWGGIATGVFGDYSLTTQILGSLAIPAWTFFTMMLLFMALKKLRLLRVPENEELEGLDMSEHGGEAYQMV